MKYLLSLVCIVFYCFELDAQELHTHNNAANFSNESNSTNGWTGGANISSVSDNPIDGSFCLRIESTPSNQRDTRYSFPAVIGEEYNISIWARTGNQSYKPAFANWQGVSGFSTRSIGGSNWSEYTFTVTATSSNPEIRIYVSPSSGGSPGNHIFVDRVSISPSTPSDNQSPSAISDLIASNVQVNSLSLSWTEPFDNVGVTNYEVFRNDTSIGFTNTSNFNVSSGLTSGTNYTFNVFAIDAAGNRSAISNTISLQTLEDTQSPNPISDLSQSNTTSNATTLFWSTPFDNIGIVDYEIFQDSEFIGISIGNNSFNVNALDPETEYIFTVISVDAAGNKSDVSNSLRVTTNTAPDSIDPEPVTDLSSTNTTLTSTRLTWSTPFDNIGISKYDIYQDNALIFSTTANFFDINNLSPETDYAFFIIAEDASENRSVNSNLHSITTLEDNISPSVINNLQASNISITSIDLFWNPATDNVAVSGYDIFRNGLLISSNELITNFTVSNLAADTSYTFYVVAKDEAGNESQSNSITVETLSTIDYNSGNANLSTIDWAARDIFAERNVGIGTSNTQGYRLAVAGNIVAEEIKVELQTNWPDFVFDKKYELPTLEKVEKHINKYGHLLNIPSAAEIEKNGIHLGEMNAKLLQKIEELTLYLILQDKKIKSLENKIDQLNP